MKVLMVASWYGSRDAEVLSAGVFHYEQAMALRKYCDMALYYPFDTTLPCEFSAQEERGLMTYRRRLRRSGIPKLEGIREILRIVSDLRRICADFRPDLIHAHCSVPAGRAAVVFGKLYHYPVVITEHNPMEMLHTENPWKRWQEGFTYRHSSANVCVSGDSMERLQRVFPDVDFQVIYNGILDPKTVAAEGTRYAREGMINCCIVGAFYDREVKGYQYLLPAIAKLRQEGVPVILHICGGGEYFDYYVRMAEELGIADACVFYGSCSREKVYEIISQMDFGISSSIYECSGVSVEETQMLGKPMLVTRSGGANSLVTEKTAIVVDRGSVEALVEGIREMIRKRAEFDPTVIRQYAYDNFEIDQVSRHYLRLYRELTENESW